MLSLRSVSAKLVSVLFLFLGLGGFAQADEIGFAIGLTSAWESVDNIDKSFNQPLIGSAAGVSGYLLYGAKVDGYLNGQISVNYNTFMANPGVTTLSLGFNPTAGLVHAHGGMGADLSFWVSGLGSTTLLGNGANYNINNSFTEIGQPAYAESNEAHITAASFGLDPFASVSLDFDLTITNRFKPKSLDGTLNAHLRENPGIWHNFQFSIDAETETLEINLDQPGTWDFNFLPFYLLNDFDIGGKGAWTARGNVILLGSIDLYSMDMGSFPILPTQQLPFSEQVWRPDMFSITVGDGQTSDVPEPTSLLLLGTGLGVIALAARRRKK
jgi:hypothetical protein